MFPASGFAGAFSSDAEKSRIQGKAYGLAPDRVYAVPFLWSNQLASTQGVTADFVRSGTYELEVATERVPCTVSLKPLYDPTNSRVKA